MHLFLECATGISGDMLVAALADLGGDLDPLRHAFEASSLGMTFRVEERQRSGLRGKCLRVVQAKDQPLRRLSDLMGAVDRLALDATVREKSIHALRRLAEVESKVHGIALEEVHFHEVGAADTLVDVVAVFHLLHDLGVETVHCNTLPWFSGRVQTAHGNIPLPAPATAELLKNKPVRPTDFEQELITPTGALLLDSIVNRFTTGPEGSIRKVGLGWGDHDLGDVPNQLRVIAFEPKGAGDRVWVLETNIDHLTGEEIGGLFESLFKAGSLDVIFLPGLMKKNRPGGQLQVMCRTEMLESVQNVLFRQSLTLGLRRRLEERVVLSRRESVFSSPLGELRAKEMDLDGIRITRPEYEALKALAQKTGRSVAELRYLMMEGKGGLKEGE